MNLIDRPLRSISLSSLSGRLITGVIALSGGLLIVFDILRKTIFLNASWNYHYPRHRLVYDPILTFLLIAFAIMLIWLIPWLLNTSKIKFVVLIYLFSLFLSTLSLYIMPLIVEQVTTPPNDEFSAAAMIVIEQGPLEFFNRFHTIGVPAGSSPHTEEAQMVASALAAANWLPGNEQMAMYAVKIKVQKHGPVPILILAPIIYLIQLGVRMAVIGKYILLAGLPVIAYYTNRLYFTEYHSRIGSLLILSAPAYHIYQRNLISYDIITAIFLGLSVYFLLRAFRHRSNINLGISGISFSLAALSKISALPILGAFGILIYLKRESMMNFILQSSVFAVSAVIAPIVSLIFGYNFLIQYLFTIARQLNQSSMSAAHPASYLKNPLLNVLSPIYNARLLGIPLLFLAFLYIIRLAWEFDWSLSEREMITVSLLVPFIPFIFVMPGLTAARHLIALIIPLGFIGVHGLEYINPQQLIQIRLVRMAVAVNIGILIVGL